MAATAVYASVARIPEGPAQGYEAFSVSNTSASQTFTLKLGGKYQVSVVGSTFGTVTLQALGPDGSTYLNAATAFSANGLAVVELPPGQYKLALG